MSHRIADDLLQVELQAELELMCDDQTIQYTDGMTIEDIFSSSEEDYKLFELNEEPISENVVENQSIWKSYFDKISSKQHIYLHESQNILTETKQTCVDTLKLCNVEIEEKEEQTSVAIEETPSNDHETEEKQPIIEIENKKSSTSSLNMSYDESIRVEEEEIITTNPCIPCHAVATPPFIIMNCTEPQTPSLNLNEAHCESVNRDTYNMELQKLENELKQVTQSHQEEQQTNTSGASWSTLLYQSKALYDEYMETTHKIKRDKERLIMIEYFADWKYLYLQNKRKKLQLIKLTQHMEHAVYQLMNKAMLTSHTVTQWSVLILKYRHQMKMNRIRSHALWKSCVVDYILFHYEQSYESVIKHRNVFKLKCLPLIQNSAACYEQRRILKIWTISVAKISIWYQHHRNKKKLIQSVAGIYRLCVFRNKYIDNPLLIMKKMFIAWIHATKSRKCSLKSIRNKWMKESMHKNIRYWKYQTRYNRAKRSIICFRNTKQRRMRYLKHNAAVCMQSYFRMFYIRSITHDVQSKLCAIHDMFAINDNQIDEEFKTLDTCEYIFDDTIIDWDLKPLSNPPSPPPQITNGDRNNEEDHESSEENDENNESSAEDHSSSSNASQSDEESQINEESVESEEISQPQNEHKFESEQLQKSWLKRKKKFNPKKFNRNSRYALSKLNRFNKMKHGSHSFGAGNRFKNKKKKKSNKPSKPKFVKFGCP